MAADSPPACLRHPLGGHRGHDRRAPDDSPVIGARLRGQAVGSAPVRRRGARRAGLAGCAPVDSGAAPSSPGVSVRVAVRRLERVAGFGPAPALSVGTASPLAGSPREPAVVARAARRRGVALGEEAAPEAAGVAAAGPVADSPLAATVGRRPDVRPRVARGLSVGAVAPPAEPGTASTGAPLVVASAAAWPADRPPRPRRAGAVPAVGAGAAPASPSPAALTWPAGASAGTGGVASIAVPRPRPPRLRAVPAAGVASDTSAAPGATSRPARSVRTGCPCAGRRSAPPSDGRTCSLRGRVASCARSICSSSGGTSLHGSS